MLERDNKKEKLSPEEKTEYKDLRRAVKEIYKNHPFLPAEPEKSPLPSLKSLFMKTSPNVLYYYYKRCIHGRQNDSTLNVILISLICGLTSSQIMSFINAGKGIVLGTLIAIVVCVLPLLAAKDLGTPLVKEKELEIISGILHFEKYLAYDKRPNESTENDPMSTETPPEPTGREMAASYSASEQFYNAAKAEYDYESSRNSTLDNKVSMTLAFCGVVFLLLISYLDILAIWKNDEIICCWQCILKFISSTLQIVCLACFAVCVIKLFLILRPRTYYRLDANFLLKETLPEWEEEQAYMYLGKRYTDFTVSNRNVNEARSKEYSRSVKWLLFAMLFCVINEIIKFNFL